MLSCNEFQRNIVERIVANVMGLALMDVMLDGCFLIHSSLRPVLATFLCHSVMLFVRDAVIGFDNGI